MMLEDSENVMTETEINAEPQVAEVSVSKKKSCKKNNKMPVVIVAILAVIVLVGAGIFVVPKLFSSKTSGSLSESAKYSKIDEEQITSIISEAEALASKEDYESALAKIENGLTSYPKSVELKNKVDELNNVIKEKTLTEAKAFADSGDYVSAIALIKKAQQKGDDAEYQSAFKTYNSAYKTEVITSANTLIEDGDYVGAIKKIEIAISNIGKEVDLTNRLNDYQINYVSKICSEIDILVSEEKYEDAITLVNDALNVVKGNDELQSKLETINAKKPKPLVDILQPYQSNDYEVFSNGISVTMGGIKRYNGFTLDVYGWNGQSCAIYNVNKSYNKLTGIIGYVDGRIGNGETWDVNIYADDKLVYTCTVSPGDLPQEFLINLTGVTKLEFRTGARNGFTGYIGFAELKLS